MKSITIKGSQRESVGKTATKALRNAGKVPCVLYGGDAPIHFSAEEKAFRNLVYTPNVYTAKIELENETYESVLQDIQFHPVTDKILHIDFYQLFEDKHITMEIPVKLIGKPKGVMIGGVLHRNINKLRVRTLPANLPDSIEADISDLEIGDRLYVTSVKSDYFTILHPDNTVIAQVRASRNISKSEEEEEAEGEGAEETPATEEGETKEN